MRIFLLLVGLVAMIIWEPSSFLKLVKPKKLAKITQEQAVKY
ncbi:MAG: hypothetical protein AAF770_00440 [Bacteroidota bacterium]